MTDLVFYFQVHQPFRLRKYSFFDVGVHQRYFDEAENARILRRVAEKCYLPMNELVLEAIERHDGAFRCAYSISGSALAQMEEYSPATLESFQRLAATGAVEFLAETSMHSLESLFDAEEFAAQVRTQAASIERLFGQKPTTFRNTELVIDESICRAVEELGFEAILGEGADMLLGRKSGHEPWRPNGCERLQLLLRDYEFSDDIAFRFSNRTWTEWPLGADKFVRWLCETDPEDSFIGLFMDYETFGEHQWAETGIFEFMRRLPDLVLDTGRFAFATPRETARRHAAAGTLAIPRPVSWADAERDLSAWLGNPMQRAAAEALHSIAADVRKMALAGQPEHRAQWQRLSTSDHLYYMCTKWFSDGDVHKYFSPYPTPHDAFITFMNVLDDLTRRVQAESSRAGTAEKAKSTRGRK